MKKQYGKILLVQCQFIQNNIQIESTVIPQLDMVFSLKYSFNTKHALLIS